MFIFYVNFSYVYFIYAGIFEKMSSGGLEVSFSIFLLKNIDCGCAHKTGLSPQVIHY